MATNSELLRLALNDNQLSGTIPEELAELQNLHAFLISFNSITGTIPSSFSKLQRTLLVFEALSGEGKTPLQGGCFPESLNPAECRLSEQTALSCSCPAPSSCGACECYDYTGEEMCARGLHRCRRGCTCLPQGLWYSCSCPPGIKEIPPEIHCKRNNECELWGCGTNIASCVEGLPNQRTCNCPEGHPPLGETLLISDEKFAGCEGAEECEEEGCYIVPPVVGLTTAQKVGISLGALVALAVIGGVCVLLGLGRCAWNSAASYSAYSDGTSFTPSN